MEIILITLHFFITLLLLTLLLLQKAPEWEQRLKTWVRLTLTEAEADTQARSTVPRPDEVPDSSATSRAPAPPEPISTSPPREASGPTTRAQKKSNVTHVKKHEPLPLEPPFCYGKTKAQVKQAQADLQSNPLPAYPFRPASDQVKRPTLRQTCWCTNAKVCRPCKESFKTLTSLNQLQEKPQDLESQETTSLSSAATTPTELRSPSTTRPSSPSRLELINCFPCSLERRSSTGSKPASISSTPSTTSSELAFRNLILRLGETPAAQHYKKRVIPKVPQPGAQLKKPLTPPSQEVQPDLWSNLPTAALQPAQEGELWGQYLDQDPTTWLKYPFIRLNTLPEEVQENLVRFWVHSCENHTFLKRSLQCIACYFTNLNRSPSSKPEHLNYSLRTLCPSHYREINSNSLLKIHVLPYIDKLAQNDLRSLRVATGHWELPQVRSFYPLRQTEAIPTPKAKDGYSQSALKERAKLQLIAERRLRQGLELPIPSNEDFSHGVLDL